MRLHSGTRQQRQWQRSWKMESIIDGKVMYCRRGVRQSMFQFMHCTTYCSRSTNDGNGSLRVSCLFLFLLGYEGIIKKRSNAVSLLIDSSVSEKRREGGTQIQTQTQKTMLCAFLDAWMYSAAAAAASCIIQSTRCVPSPRTNDREERIVDLRTVSMQYSSKHT